MKRKQPRKAVKKVPAKKIATATNKTKAKPKRTRSLENQKSPILAFTFKDASRLSGVRTATLRQWLLEEKIVRGEDRSFNVTQLMELASKEGQSLKSGVARSPQAQQNYEKYWHHKQEMLSLDLQIKKGELIDKELVVQALVERETLLKNNFLGMCSQVAPKLVGLGASEIQAILMEHVMGLLKELVRKGSAGYSKARAP